jgi:hypothetical protein
MRMDDIIDQLRAVVPSCTDLFSSVKNCVITSAAGVVTVDTSPLEHGLTVGKKFSISDALAPYAVSSLTLTGSTVVAVTTSDHDLTEGWQEVILVEGAVETGYNGTQTLTRVPNRRTFEYEITTTPSSPATGTIKMVDPLSSSYTGVHEVDTVVSDTAFTYAVDADPQSPALGSPRLHTAPRISGAVTEDRMRQAYTKQPEDDFWLVVTTGETTTSRNRAIESDAIETLTDADLMKVRQIETISIFCLAPAKSSIAARSVVDKIDSEVKPAILKALLGYKPKSVYFETNWCMLVPSGDGFADYDSATYVHRFDFERSIDLVRQDGVSPAPTKAWRDTQLSWLNDYKESVMESDIDMDDVPL